MTFWLAAFVVLALPQQPSPPMSPVTQAPPAQQATAAALPPPCATSEDPTYAYTTQNPAQVGGGAMYVAARERRYMDALRGPNGQVITYKRLGSLPQGPNSQTILDAYQVTYDGLEKPITIYIDAYHYWDPAVPKGFICGQPMQLQPMMDNFRASDALMATAIEAGAAREFTPIPLEEAGAVARGAVWDGFRMLAIASRAGNTTKPAASQNSGTVIVAYPLDCDGRKVAPATIDLVPGQGQPVPREGDYVKEDAVGKLLPGVTVPPGSLAARYRLLQLGSNNRVRITYDGAACQAGAPDAVLPLRFTPARPANFAMPALPEGANPDQKRILLQVVIDLDGHLQKAAYVGGPAHLEKAALEAVTTWRATPATLNGAPVPTMTAVEVRFR